MIPIFTPLIAVLLPAFVLYRCYKERPLKKAYLYSVGSFTAALTAVCLEVRTIGIRAAEGDFGGIEDTMTAVLIICVGIAVVTVLLNLMALAAAYGE
ncbi:MAG: hypothetical protein IJA67_00695 [Oscillospiraceae bacterium]|nr:hypothetical protein [Oscillospiraceae bacterium]